MIDFLRKLFRRQQAPQSIWTDEDSNWTQFYTDTDQALEALEHLITAASLPKRLLVIHGLGGVGKSTLLKMYSLLCRKHRIPAAIVASEETPSPVDVLEDWAQDLSRSNVTLPVFQKTLKHFRAIQARVAT